MKLSKNAFNLDVLINSTANIPYDGCSVLEDVLFVYKEMGEDNLSLYNIKSEGLYSKDILEKVKEKEVLGGCILDYLLSNTLFIPEKWKKHRVYFFGTVYHFSHFPFVRYLYWKKGFWSWGLQRLDSGAMHYENFNIAIYQVV